MPAEERHGVTAAIRVMARVEAQEDPRGIGLVEERLDLVLVLDMCLGVRVIHERQTKAVAAPGRRPCASSRSALPGVVIEAAGGGRTGR